MSNHRSRTLLDTMIDDTLLSIAMECRGSRVPDPSDFEHIIELFGNSTFDLLEDFIEGRKLESIHKVLLGIDEHRRTLNDYLEKSNTNSLLVSSIDLPDATGRTALAWAVEYGCVDATRTLLQHGAN